MPDGGPKVRLYSPYLMPEGKHNDENFKRERPKIACI